MAEFRHVAAGFRLLLHLRARGFAPLTRLRANALIYNSVSSSYKIMLGKSSGDFDRPETQIRPSGRDGSQTTNRQTLLKPRIFPASVHTKRRYRHGELAGVREPSRTSLHFRPCFQLFRAIRRGMW